MVIHDILFMCVGMLCHALMTDAIAFNVTP